MNILDQIVLHKRKEVTDRKRAVSIRALEQGFFFKAPTFSLKEFVRSKDSSGIIAEFKRRSPSKGVINANASVECTTTGYVRAGASALSVLTDQQFFGGSNEDLSLARKHSSCPILRKDFTIDEYQIIEAKSIGADAILLIAAVLDPAKSKKFAALAHALGLEVLLEVHDESELRDNLETGADLIGVNNRNLKNFTVSTDISKKLAPLIPDGVVKVSESGISTPNAIVDLKTYGYEGFLIGENFMKHAEPEVAAAEFINELNKLTNSNK
ncbi:MAG: indole-3-glycerol phosphate synthase TrpC [Cyclobacteriaceae bacterium]